MVGFVSSTRVSVRSRAKSPPEAVDPVAATTAVASSKSSRYVNRITQIVFFPPKKTVKL